MNAIELFDLLNKLLVIIDGWLEVLLALGLLDLDPGGCSVTCVDSGIELDVVDAEPLLVEVELGEWKLDNAVLDLVASVLTEVLKRVCLLVIISHLVESITILKS